MTLGGPTEISFNQTEKITHRLRDLVRNYPKGVGLVKEFLQNADDSGATKLTVIYDRRQHPGEFPNNPEMNIALAPSLLFVNDRVFSEDDFKRIQRIGEGGKVHEASGTGRFGQGFNTCYSVSDHPSLLSGDFIAWFDPHHCVFTDGKNAHAWSPISEVEKHWAEWMNTFKIAGWKPGQSSFPGTVFRLPLRSVADAERSEILKEAFKETDFDGIIEEIRKIGAGLLVFLRSVSKLEIREIEQNGVSHERYKIETVNREEVERHRKVLREMVAGDPTKILESWARSGQKLPIEKYGHTFNLLDNGVPQKQEWSVVTGLFRGPEDILLVDALNISKHEEKAIPWAGAAICTGEAEGHPKLGGLACFLPLPEQIAWPVWLHGWFDLSSNRRRITREADIGETTTSRQNWNKCLMRYGVGQAWALLIQRILGQAEDDHKPYKHWARLPEKSDDVDSSLVIGFYEAIAGLAVIRGRDKDGFKWLPIGQIRDLPQEWNERLAAPLVAEGWSVSQPALPDFVKTQLRKVGVTNFVMSPKDLRNDLRISAEQPDISCHLHEAPRPMLTNEGWIRDLAEYCAEGNFDNLERLPLALLSDGRLHTFTTCGKIYIARDDERALLYPFPEIFISPVYQHSLGLCKDYPKINLTILGLDSLLQYLPKVLSPSKPDDSWFVKLFDYLCSLDVGIVKAQKDGLCKIHVLRDKNGVWRAMGHVMTPLICGNHTQELICALSDLGIPLLTLDNELKSAIIRFSTKHKGFIWELTPHDLADNLQSHAKENCLNEEALDKSETLGILLDYLSPPTWLKDNDQRLSDLQRVRMLPTTSGQRVTAQQNYVYIPVFTPPRGFEGKYILLDTKGEKWTQLFKSLKVRHLDLVVFVKDVLLPAFDSSTPEQCLSYLRWIRDDLRAAAANLSEVVRDELRNEIRRKPIIPINSQDFRSPSEVYNPDSTLPSRILGKFAIYPDRSFFTKDKDLWVTFFREYKLQTHPLAKDIYRKIKYICSETSVSLLPESKIQLRKLVDYISENWNSLSKDRVEESLTFAGALKVAEWLPANHEEGLFAAAGKWPNKLWRASQLVPGRIAHLCASKYPVLEGNVFPREMADALGLKTTVTLDEVLEHFVKVRECKLEERVYETVHKAAEGFYRYVGQLESSTLKSNKTFQDLKKDLCIWGDNRWWHPSQCFFEKLPFKNKWAFSLTSGRINTTEQSVMKGLTELGVRPHPEHEDWLMMIADFADRFRGMPLPPAELKQVQYAVRLLRSATAEWLKAQDVLVPLHDGRLELAKRAFVPDDLRVKTLSFPPSLPLIEDNEDSIDVGSRSGATSLHGAMSERLKFLPMPSRTSASLQLATKLEQKLKSEQFYQCLRRIAYEEAGRVSGGATDPTMAASASNLTIPSRIKILITPSINVETIVTIDEDEVVVFEKEANFFIEKQNLRLWLREGKQRKIKDEVVRVVCDLCGLFDMLTVSRVLEAEPMSMSSVLDEEEIATVPEGQILNLDDIGESEVEYVDIDLDHADSCSDNVDEDFEVDAESTDVEIPDITLTQHRPNIPASVTAQSHHQVKQHVVSGSGTVNTGVASGHSASITTPNVDFYNTSNSQNEPPIAPGHGSSRPWSAGGTTQHTTETVSRSHAPSNPSAGYSGNSVPSGTDEPPTVPGHGSSRPWSDGSTTQHTTETVSRGHAPSNPSAGYSGKSVPSGTHGGHHSPASSTKSVADKSDTARQVRLRTYVHEHPQDDYDNSDSNSVAKELGDLGERIVLEHEKKRNRDAKQMPRNNEGYDIESTGRDGIRYIEVKSIDGPWGIRGVGVTRAQYEAAMRLGKSWWLYVVEHVKDPVRKKVHVICNPFHSATEFRFDSGWAGTPVHQVGITPASTKPKIGARYQRETGEIVTIENTVQRGQFWRVTYTAPDGSRQRAVWDLTWRMI